MKRERTRVKSPTRKFVTFVLWLVHCPVPTLNMLRNSDSLFAFRMKKKRSHVVTPTTLKRKKSLLLHVVCKSNAGVFPLANKQVQRSFRNDSDFYSLLFASFATLFFFRWLFMLQTDAIRCCSCKRK